MDPTQDEIADLLEGEKPLSEQVLRLGGYVLELVTVIESLAKTVDIQQGSIKELVKKVNQMEALDE